MTAAPLKLGTRGSQLALFQANTVARLIEDAGATRPEIVVIKTSGDRLQEAPLSEIGGKRLFVKELEDALFNHEIDLAVHSSKDMPAVLPPGLTIAGVLPRAEPHDAVVLPLVGGRSQEIGSLAALVGALGPAPSIGTSSVRRIAQLTRLMPHAKFSAIRGNLDTRLRKLDGGDYDALVLAAAGLIRLGFDQRISLKLPLDASVPAPGQGIIAVEIRDGDDRTADAVRPITDAQTALVLDAERALVEALGGGCQTPIGAVGQIDSTGAMHLLGLVVSLDGRTEARAHAIAPAGDAAALGARVAGLLLEQGAGAILEQAQRAAERA
jgi:hydroxymethylbilane synthase